MNHVTQNVKLHPGSLSQWRSVIRVVCGFLFLFSALGLPIITRANDTYGAMLDKRFEAQSKMVSTNEPSAEHPEGTSDKVADLERALKKRAAKIELAPPPAPAPNVNLGVAILIASGVAALVLLKMLFVLSRVKANREAQAIVREEQFIKSVVQEPTVVSLLSDLKHRLDPSADETLPEAHAEVCRNESDKADDAALAEAAVQVFESAPMLFSQFRKRFTEISRNPDTTARLKSLEEFSQEIRPSKMATRIPALRSHRLLAIALEGFLKQISARPKNITAWRMQLASETLDLLDDLYVPNLAPDLATKPLIRLLVVDDCAVSRHSMVFALKKVFREPDLAGGGAQALALATKNSYDAIFLDIDMPGMDGFELCEKIRQTALNCKTPIVFVTSHDNQESRAKLATKGAQDLIGKPYLPTEITLKALQLSLYGRLKHQTVEGASAEAPATTPLPVLTEASSAA